MGNREKWQDWDLDALRDDILGGSKHKNVDDIVVNPKMESYIYEDSLSDAEVESLMDKARRSVVKIRMDGKRNKEEKETAAQVLRWIERVKRTWKNNNSLHPNTIVALMKIVAGTNSANKKGWGYRTIGWEAPPDGKVPSDFRNEGISSYAVD